ncbi:MAG TPA: TlpA disulfide reductase family protein [Cytophagaceae bacterium]|nr:TlpA disulfide reductase family protein [Cytophagaceae bacterium]
MNGIKKYFLSILCLALLVGLAAARFILPPIQPGDDAPDFTLYKLGGGTVSLHDYKGKTTVVHIWSHTCPHCRKLDQTLPDIVRPYRKSNIVYIMIDIDSDTIGWRDIVKEDKLNFAIHALDPHDGASKIMEDYNAPGTPCINIVDRKGKLTAVNINTAEELQKALNNLKRDL